MAHRSMKNSQHKLPMGCSTKEMKGVEGSGGIMDYPDSPEEIHREQEASVSKAEGRKLKPGYRY